MRRASYLPWAVVLMAALTWGWWEQSGFQAPQQPILEVHPRSLEFRGQVGGSPPEPQYLTIANAGGGLMKWTASTDREWIVLGATNGKLSQGRAVQLLVLVDTKGLRAGEHQGTITVTARDADTGQEAQGSPAHVQVTLSLAAPPQLEVSSTSLNFQAEEGGSDPPAQQITLRNTGGGPLSWTAQVSEPWLRLSRIRGSLPPGASERLQVSVTIANLAPGSYEGEIVITSPEAGATRRVSVTLTLLPAPGSLLFQDDFSNPNSGWCTGSDNNHAYSYENGKYSITVRKRFWMYWCWAP